MLKRTVTLSIGLVLAIVSVGGATVLDNASVGENFFVLDDAGRIWLWDEEMPGHGCAWHLLDTFPGAVLIEWTRNTSGSLIGAIVTGSDLQVVQFIESARTFSPIASYPLPTSDAIDVGLGGATGTFWLRLSTGEFWFGRYVGPDFSWFGPCDGPTSTVALEEQSFGKAKAAYR